MSTLAPSPETLLVAAMALQAMLLVLLARTETLRDQAGDASAARGALVFPYQHAALAVGFLIASAAAIWIGAVDRYVVIFAAMFVLAQAVQARLAISGALPGWSALSLRAAAIALAGLLAMVTLSVLPADVETMVPR